MADADILSAQNGDNSLGSNVGQTSQHSVESSPKKISPSKAADGAKNAATATITTHTNIHPPRNIHDDMPVDDNKESLIPPHSPQASSNKAQQRAARRKDALARNKKNRGDPAKRTDDEIRDRLNTFNQRHQMYKYLEQADANKFKNCPRDEHNNAQILIKPRLIIKNFYNGEGQWISNREILDGLWAINRWSNPFICITANKIKLQQSGKNLIFIIKEEGNEFTSHFTQKSYPLNIYDQHYKLEYQPGKLVYPECRMILEGVPRRYHDYKKLKQDICDSFHRKVQNGVTLRALKQFNHPIYTRFKEINDVNPSVLLPMGLIKTADNVNEETVNTIKNAIGAFSALAAKTENIVAVQREQTDNKDAPPRVHISVKGIPEEYFKDSILICDTEVKIVYDTRFIAESVVLQRIPQCYSCWGLGHFSDKCHRLEYVWCRKCGEKGHNTKQCKNAAHCAMCAGKHRAYKSSCPGFKPLIRTYRIGKDLIRNGDLSPTRVHQWTNQEILKFADEIQNKLLHKEKKINQNKNKNKNKMNNHNNNNNNNHHQDIMEVDNDHNDADRADNEHKAIETGITPTTPTNAGTPTSILDMAMNNLNGEYQKKSYKHAMVNGKNKKESDDTSSDNDDDLNVTPQSMVGAGGLPLTPLKTSPKRIHRHRSRSNSPSATSKKKKEKEKENRKRKFTAEDDDDGGGDAQQTGMDTDDAMTSSPHPSKKQKLNDNHDIIRHLPSGANNPNGPKSTVILTDGNDL